MQTAPPKRVEAPPTRQGATGPTSAEPVVTAVAIAVRVPPQFSDLRVLVESHIELQRFRAVTDLDEAELARLIVLAEHRQWAARFGRAHAPARSRHWLACCHQAAA